MLPRRERRERRLFYGTVVSAESWLVLELIAAELAGRVDVVVLLESVVQHSGQPRKLRFAEGGPDTPALLALFARHGLPSPTIAVWRDESAVKEPAVGVAPVSRSGFGDAGMQRQSAMREALARKWVDAGMTPSDVGIVADPDEAFTGEFMRALKECDVPPFRASHECDNVKIVGRAIVFEGFLNCAQGDRAGGRGAHFRWFHPDAIPGRCLAALNPGAAGARDRKRLVGWHGERAPKGALWTTEEVRTRAGWGGRADDPAGRPRGHHRLPLSQLLRLARRPPEKVCQLRRAHPGAAGLVEGELGGDECRGGAGSARTVKVATGAGGVELSILANCVRSPCGS